MDFSRPEYWSGWPFPSPGALPTKKSNPGLPHCKWILSQLSHKGSPYMYLCVYICIFVCAYQCVYVHCCHCLVTKLRLTLCNPMDCSPPASSVHGDSPGKNTVVACHALPPPGDLPNSAIEPRSPALQMDSLPSELPGKPISNGRTSAISGQM